MGVTTAKDADAPQMGTQDSQDNSDQRLADNFPEVRPQWAVPGTGVAHPMLGGCCSFSAA